MDFDALLTKLSGFIEKLPAVGITGKRAVLCLAAILAAYMATHGVAPQWCIVFLVVVYLLEPCAEILRQRIDQRNGRRHLTVDRSEFRQYIRRTRGKLKPPEPELPLPPPRNPESGSKER